LSPAQLSALGAFAVGLAFGFGWTPCVGPVLASILLFATTTDTVGQGVALLAAYSAGIAVPFLAAALFTRPFLRLTARFRRHLGLIEKIMGGAHVTGLGSRWRHADHRRLAGIRADPRLIG
jgi:cytochrome c-type biogenesis protein